MMAAVHFVITIPTKTKENRCRRDFPPVTPHPLGTSSPSAQLAANPSDSGDVCDTNLGAEARNNAFPTMKMKRTRATDNHVLGDMASGSTGVKCELATDLETGMKEATTGEGLLPSGNDTKAQHHTLLRLPPDTCMEIVMKELLAVFQIDNAVWAMDSDEERLQVSFTVDMVEKYENILEVLADWGIGERKGTTVTVMNCISFMSSAKQDNDEDITRGENSNQQKQTAWKRFMASVRRRLSVVQLVREIRQDASITFDFIVLVVSAAILAAFGLVEDSSIFLAASMLISPLMGPIIAAIFGTVIKDSSLCLLGICNEMIGVMTATLVGFTFGLIVCSIDDRYGIGEGVTNEMLSRCDLHSLVVGVFTAMASGAAAAVGVLGANIGSLIGVAISASLLPPAVNTGLLWALAMLFRFHENDSSRYNSVLKSSFYSKNQATELMILGCISMSLTLLNVICVYIMGIVVLKIKEIAPIKSQNNKQRQFWKQNIKIARDLYKNGLEPDNEFSSLPTDEKSILSWKSNIINSSCYQNTWSPSGNQIEVDGIQLPLGYQTVYHSKPIGSSVDKRFAIRLKTTFGAQRKQNNRSMDLGHYAILTENASPLQTVSSTIERDSKDNQTLVQFSTGSSTPQSTMERKKRNFIVTPVTAND